MRINDLISAKDFEHYLLYKQADVKTFPAKFAEHMERLRDFYPSIDEFVERQAKNGIPLSDDTNILAAKAICRALLDLIDEALAHNTTERGNIKETKRAHN